MHGLNEKTVGVPLKSGETGTRSQEGYCGVADISDL